MWLGRSVLCRCVIELAIWYSKLPSVFRKCLNENLYLCISDKKVSLQLENCTRDQSAVEWQNSHQWWLPVTDPQQHYSDWWHCPGTLRQVETFCRMFKLLYIMILSEIRSYSPIYKINCDSPSKNFLEAYFWYLDRHLNITTIKKRCSAPYCNGFYICWVPSTSRVAH